MRTTTTTTTTALLAEMRDWIADTFPYDAPDNLTDAEVLTAVSHHYIGGIIQFEDDGQ